MPRRRAASPNSGSTDKVGRKTVAVDEDIVLRKPFGQLKYFRKEDASPGARC